MINLSQKKVSPRPTTFALFGLYKNTDNNISKEIKNQTKHKTIFSSVFPNKNKLNNDEPIDMTKNKGHKHYKNKGVIEIKEDDEESSSSSNSYSNSREKNKKNKGDKRDNTGNREDHKIETFKILVERYKKNKEKLKNNIGERKFYLLEQILIKNKIFI